MAVGSHKCQIVRVNIEIDTIHYRTKFVVSRCKQRAADTVQQHLRVHHDGDRVIIQRFLLRICVSLLSDKIIFTILEMDKNFQVIIVNIKSQRLFGQLLQWIEQDFCRDSEKPASLCIHHVNGCNQTCFSIRSCYGKFITFQVEKETVQDR